MVGSYAKLLEKKLSSVSIKKEFDPHTNFLVHQFLMFPASEKMGAKCDEKTFWDRLERQHEGQQT